MAIRNPLVITGQAYWGESGPGQSVMEDKLETFVETFQAWDRIVGFNWWHAGGVGAKAMSPVMVDLLSGANLNDKGYADA
jgi:hypothetical protein